ncbi:hypothetical protein EJB05_56141, partial [Eragrostis curvula]
MDRRIEGETEAERATVPTTVADLSALLPEDVLADVLRRLAPRDLAASRCVCKAWLAVVDARRLLRTQLLLLWLCGIFINFNGYYISEFFARPSTSRPSVSGNHDYLPQEDADTWAEVHDHCNGLLLVEGDNEDEVLMDYVFNPATRWVAPLTPPPSLNPDLEMDRFQDIYRKYLVYDPAISLHYKVFMIPFLRIPLQPDNLHYDRYMDQLDPVFEQSEWPPSPFILHVFSSKTGQWEERSFAREGEAAGIVADIRQSYVYEQRNAVYWRGALYVHCQTDFVMRILVSDGRYQVIKPPAGTKKSHYPQFYLGKSKNGVHCAKLRGWCLKVWILRELGDQTEWVFKHDGDILGCLLKHNISSRWHYQRQNCRPWLIQNINANYRPWLLQNINAEHNRNDTMEQPVDENFDWCSDVSSDENSPSDNAYDDKEAARYPAHIDILGFHPYKEVIFLSQSLTRGLAYDFTSLKVKVLGNLCPAQYNTEVLPNEQLINSSFPYTPCWLGQGVD